MRQLRNTLYVSTEGAWLHKDGENLVMDVEGQKRGRVPIHMLQALVCFGRVMLSPQLMGFCAEKGITVTLPTENFWREWRVPLAVVCYYGDDNT